MNTIQQVRNLNINKALVQVRRGMIEAMERQQPFSWVGGRHPRKVQTGVYLSCSQEHFMKYAGVRK